MISIRDFLVASKIKIIQEFNRKDENVSQNANSILHFVKGLRLFVNVSKAEENVLELQPGESQLYFSEFFRWDSTYEVK